LRRPDRWSGSEVASGPARPWTFVVSKLGLAGIEKAISPSAERTIGHGGRDGGGNPATLMPITSITHHVENLPSLDSWRLIACRIVDRKRRDTLRDCPGKVLHHAA
jgi:hypothetical protein